MGMLKKEPAKTPEPRQRKDEEEYEQKHEHLIGQNDPHCLKSGEERALVFLEGRIRRGKSDCQAHGRDGRFIHHRESLYRKSLDQVGIWKRYKIGDSEVDARRFSSTIHTIII